MRTYNIVMTLFVLTMLLLLLGGCGSDPYLTPGFYDLTIKNVEDTKPPLWNSEGATARVQYTITKKSGPNYTMGRANQSSDMWKGKREGNWVVFRDYDIRSETCYSKLVVKLRPTEKGLRGEARNDLMWDCEDWEYWIGPYYTKWTITGVLEAVDVNYVK